MRFLPIDGNWFIIAVFYWLYFLFSASWNTLLTLMISVWTKVWYQLVPFEFLYLHLILPRSLFLISRTKASKIKYFFKRQEIGFLPTCSCWGSSIVFWDCFYAVCWQLAVSNGSFGCNSRAVPDLRFDAAMVVSTYSCAACHDSDFACPAKDFVCKQKYIFNLKFVLKTRD